MKMLGRLLAVVLFSAPWPGLAQSNYYVGRSATFNSLGLGKTYVLGANSGMKCDGATDDAAALQAAVNAAQALGSPATANGGGVLVPPAGICIVGSDITIIKGITIEGAGVGIESGAGNSGGTVFRDSRTTGTVFAVASTAAVVFRNLTIDSSNYKTSGGCISFTGTGGSTINDGSRVEGVKCLKAYDGITLTEAQNFTAGAGTFIQDYVHDGILKINAQNPDAGQDHYSGITIQDANRHSTGTEANNPFTTTNTSAVVTVAHTAHGLITGMKARWQGSTAVNNVTLNGAYTVTVVNANSFTVVANTTANASGAGGGNATLYYYGSNAGFEYRAGGDIAISGSKFIGSCWGFLDNATYGPTGSVRISGNSIEDAACADIGFMQTTSGIEHSNFVVVGNQFHSLGAGGQSYYGLVYATTGTPTSKPKWLENVVVTGNVLLGASTLGQGIVNFQDGAGILIDDNVVNNQGNNGSGGALVVGSAATNVVIGPQNVQERLGDGGMWGTITPASLAAPATIRQIFCTTIAQNTTNYCSMGNPTPNAGVEPAGIEQGPMLLRNLTVGVVTTPAAGQTYTATIYKDSAYGAGGAGATAITCQIANPNRTCTDTTHTATLADGNVWFLQIVTSATSGSTGNINAVLGGDR